MQMNSWGSGITQVGSLNVNNNGAGDTDALALVASSQGGRTAASDEGVKFLAGYTQEDTFLHTGTCNSGCTTGSVLIHGTNSGAQATGRYVIDKTNGPISTTSTAMVAGNGPSSAITVAATVPVSNAWGTLTANCGNGGATNPVAPPFSTSYTCSISVSRGTFDTSHLVCFGSQFHDCAIPTAVGGSGGSQTITIPLRKPHASGGWVYQGGMAGYGIEFTFSNQSVNGNTMRYLLDVIGSTDAHTLQSQLFVDQIHKHGSECRAIERDLSVWHL